MSKIRITEDNRAIKIETDAIEAVIPKRDPKHWMTGIEKGTFLDKATGFREVGDGLMVIDWLMEPGSDEDWGEVPQEGWERYGWYENETDPKKREAMWLAHGSSHRKRMVEGPQLCHRMKPVQPEIIRGEGFAAVKTSYRFEYAAPGRQAGSLWTQLIVFPEGKRYFFLMDEIESANDVDELILRNDTPGCIIHDRGDSFTESYLSYLSGPEGLRIPASEFFDPFPPDRKFNYRRDLNALPERFIRGYKVRDPQTGMDGPWLAGLTLEPSVVYEAWWSERNAPYDIIVAILEIHGRPTRAGEIFSAAHIVGWFDSIEEMNALYDLYKGSTVLEANSEGWRLRR